MVSSIGRDPHAVAAQDDGVVFGVLPHLQHARRLRAAALSRGIACSIGICVDLARAGEVEAVAGAVAQRNIAGSAGSRPAPRRKAAPPRGRDRSSRCRRRHSPVRSPPRSSLRAFPGPSPGRSRSGRRAGTSASPPRASLRRRGLSERRLGCRRVLARGLQRLGREHEPRPARAAPRRTLPKCAS